MFLYKPKPKFNSKPKPNDYPRSWFPVFSTALASFICITAEFTPIGLLPELASEFDTSESTIGLLVSVYALVIAVTSIPLAVATGMVVRGKLMLVVGLIFSVGHVLGSLAPSYELLMASRIIVGLSHALFWAITPGMVARLAPEGRANQAVSILIAGSALGMVLGVPLATMLGNIFGWRLSLFCIGVAAFIIFLVIYKLLPILPGQRSGSLASLPHLLRQRATLSIYLATTLTIAGHFVCFTYFTPFMEQIWFFSKRYTELFFMLMGVAGVCGSLLVSTLNKRYPNLGFILPLMVMVFSLMYLLAGQGSFVTAVLATAGWGAAITALSSAYQFRLLTLAPESTDVAIALYSVCFNVGIGFGAILGGRILDSWGLAVVGFGGSFMVALALAVCLSAMWAGRTR